MEIENTRVFGKEITNRAVNRNINKRKFDEYNNDIDCGPSKQMRRLNNYKNNSHNNNGLSHDNCSNNSNNNNNNNNNISNNNNNRQFQFSQSQVQQSEAQQSQQSQAIVTEDSREDTESITESDIDIESENEEASENNKENINQNNNNNSNHIYNESQSKEISLDGPSVNKPNYNDNANDNNNNKKPNHDKHKQNGNNNQFSNENNDNNNNNNNREQKEVEKNLSQWDFNELDNESWPTDYVDNIVAHLRFSELCQSESNLLWDRKGDYMIHQKDITSKMRLILLDWLIEVHRKFGLLQPTLFLCINLLDRFLSETNIHRSKLQLAGCCAMWVASKYHEIYAPEINDFVYISDNAFTSDELIEFEQTMLTRLKFVLTVATPLSFAQRYIKIGIWEYQTHIYPTVIRATILENHFKNNSNMNHHECKDNNNSNHDIEMSNTNNNGSGSSSSSSSSNSMNVSANDVLIAKAAVKSEEARKCARDSKIIEYLVYYLVEHCLMDYPLSLLLPSKVASSCLAYTLLGTKLQRWTSTMERETNYSLKELLPTIQAIDKIVKNVKCKHKAVRKKYSSSTKSRVALLQFNDFNMDLIVQQVNRRWN